MEEMVDIEPKQLSLKLQNRSIELKDATMLCRAQGKLQCKVTILCGFVSTNDTTQVACNRDLFHCSDKNID